MAWSVMWCGLPCEGRGRRARRHRAFAFLPETRRSVCVLVPRTAAESCAGSVLLRFLCNCCERVYRAIFHSHIVSWHVPRRPTTDVHCALWADVVQP
eukprot:2245836-Prymnesium_polylepis.1